MKIFSEKTGRIVSIIGVVVVFSSLVMFLWKETLFNFNAPIDKNAFGQFGDFFGGVIGSIWAFVGVILFYVALTEQRNDFKTNRDALNKQVDALNLQAEEFKNQREELKLARNISKEQSKTLKKQQFEATYFSLLGVRLNIVNNLPTESEKSNFFLWNRQQLHRDFPDTLDGHTLHDKAIALYREFYFQNKSILSHYYKFLYRIVKFVDDSMNSDEDKFFYIKTLRSQLTEDELFFIYYNSQSIFGANFRDLILSYNLIKHLPSVSKLEFSKYNKDFDIEKCSKRLQYCEYFKLSITKFIKKMNNNTIEILNGEEITASFKIDDDGPIFALKTGSLQQIIFEVHDKNNVYFINSLGLKEKEYKNFQSLLLRDIIYYSQFTENGDLSIDIKTNNEILIFSINSDSGYQIAFDRY